MCKECTITRKVVNSFVSKKQEFSFQELKEGIMEKGGIMRISPCYTVNDYLETLERRHEVEYKKDRKVFIGLERHQIAF